MGYFGICGGSDDSDFLCQRSSGANADTLAPLLFPDFNFNSGNSSSSKNATAARNDAIFLKDLVTAAITLQSQVYAAILAAASFFFLLGLVFLLLHKRDVKNPNADKPRRSAILKRGTFGLLALSTGLIFTAALATTETAGALRHSTESIKNAPVLMKEGVTLQVLQWMAFGFSMLFTIAAPLLAKPGFAPFNKSVV